MSAWKLACVTQNHNKIYVHDISNYRLIYILRNLSKVFEKRFFEIHDQFPERQQISIRFIIPGDFTVTQLVDLYNFICKTMDESKNVRAVFCD